MRGFDGLPTVRLGAVFTTWKTYGAVMCGFSDVNRAVRLGAVECPTVRSVRFSEIVKPTVLFGAVFRCRELYGAVRCYFLPLTRVTFRL